MHNSINIIKFMKKIKEKLNQALFEGNTCVSIQEISEQNISYLKEEGWNITFINKQFIISI